MFAEFRSFTELRYCLDIYTTAPRPKNGCNKATKKYEPAADQGYNDGWAGLVYDPKHAETIFGRGGSCGLESCTAYEDNSKLQASMTKTREEQGKSGWKHVYYQGTKNY